MRDTARSRRASDGPWQRLRAVRAGAVAVAALAVMVSACADDSPTGAPTPQPPTPTPTPTQLEAGYAWKEYNGHSYAATRGLGPWQVAAAEARALGATLVTIDDSAENAWLTRNFDGLGAPGQPHAGNCIWIGYQLVDGAWRWQDGTAAGYENVCASCYRSPGTHMYLHTASHSAAGTWNYNDQHDREFGHYLHGIIERLRPAPPAP